MPRVKTTWMIAAAGMLALSGIGVAAESSSGALVRLDRRGEPAEPCPLKHTAVKAEISGFLARVNVTQEFENPFTDKIEAVYVFPLPPKAAVDDMTIYVADRTVRGKIKRREEARAIYEAARSRGQLAGLLNQERPNVFTQSVANIPPGAKVKVVISYVETLKFDEGIYEFSFPMVVGPRYMPGKATGRSGGGWSPDTSGVPDGSKISPPVARPGTRAGHDISIEVALDAGVPIDMLVSKTHEIDLDRPSLRRASIRLKNKAVLPNKDFILQYDAVGRRIQDAVLAHHGSKGGFFTLILQPPERVTAAEVTPKELVFVLDTSGSMSGFPIEKAKEVIKLALDGLYPKDTFNLITFAGDTHLLFPQPVSASPENLRKAQEFLASRRGGGGTEMMKAIRAALDPSDRQEHVRIVCFLTDGYVGNDLEIVGEVTRHPNARVFSFGIGGSVNRFLLDKMAEEGRGEVEYVALNDDGSAAARRFHDRVRHPLLTDITLEWNGLAVADVYPRRIPDLFSAKPVVLSGRYTRPGGGILRLRGKLAGKDFVREIRADFPAREPRHDVLATLWARERIEDLMSQDWTGVQHSNMRGDLREQITRVALEHRLMTQFTSFVAVEETIVTEGGKSRRIEVPVEMPEGVSYEGVFGGESDKVQAASMVHQLRTPGFAFTGGATPSVGPPVREKVEGERARDLRMTRVDEAAGFPASVEAKRNEVLAKLDPQLAAIVQRLRGGQTAAAIQGLPFVVNGKASVRVHLADDSPAAVEKLKKLGFEVTAQPRSGGVLVGRLPLEALAALAQLTEVRFIAPV